MADFSGERLVARYSPTEKMSKSLETYTESDASDHDHAKAFIVAKLRQSARGRDHAIPSTALAEDLPVSASTVRDLIQELRRERDIPIGQADGYFLIESEAEARRQIDRQIQQAETARETARAIAAAWHRSRS